ncbi:MAG: hypothetical protein ABSG14_13325 [Verrucomicrobiia bacterium]
MDLAAAGQYAEQAAFTTADLLGNPDAIGPVGSNQVLVATTTKSALSAVSIDWEPY